MDGVNRENLNENQPNNNNNPANGLNDINNKHEAIREKQKRYHGKYFVLIILIALTIEYYIFVCHTCLGTSKASFIIKAITLVLFHLFLGMMLWAYYTTMKTHPGEIPLYWGFYIGDDDYKRKRYCLICNAFKPERSHHCSICNVCILNMDHHCPWVDNCIGFYNRKFFMQLLFYLICLLFIVDISSAYFVYMNILEIIEKGMQYNRQPHFILITFSFLFVGILSGVIFVFFKFHVRLVINNSTTIESLEKENKNDNAKFNLSPYDNWIQVFGANKLLWLFPFVCESGRPEGDGLNWPVREIKLLETRNGTNNNNDLDRSGNSRQGLRINNETE